MISCAKVKYRIRRLGAWAENYIPSVFCSRGMAGELTAALLDEKLDVNGTSFQAASTAAGYGGASHQVWPHHTQQLAVLLCSIALVLGLPTCRLLIIGRSSSSICRYTFRFWGFLVYFMCLRVKGSAYIL